MEKAETTSNDCKLNLHELNKTLTFFN